MEVKQIRVKDLRTEEGFGFLKKVETETELLTLETDKAMVDAYIEAVLAFDNVLKQSTKNSHTDEVTAADKVADETWKKFKAHVKAMRNYPDEEAAANATKVYAIFEKFGDIYKMPYSQEYASMYNLLQEVDAMGAEAHDSCFIALWIKQLYSNYNTFMEAQRLQNIEAADYQKGAIQENFDLCCAAYDNLVKRVNALAMINGEAPYAEFINRVNALIDHELNTLAAREGRAEAKKNRENGDLPA